MSAKRSLGDGGFFFLLKRKRLQERRLSASRANDESRDVKQRGLYSSDWEGWGGGVNLDHPPPLSIDLVATDDRI